MELIEQKSIENEIFTYYKDLFSNKDSPDAEITNFLDEDQVISCPKI